MDSTTLTRAAIAAVTIVVTSTFTVHDGGVSATSDCSTARSYGLGTVVDDPPWASVVGHVQSHLTVGGSQQYTLQVTERQASYARTAIAGGCGVSIRLTTRGTTGALGNGTASYEGTVEVSGASVSTSISDSGAHPLPLCDIYALICQTSETHTIDLGSAPDAGDVLTVAGTGTATADAGALTQFDQAHADWRIRYPVLVIPIPRPESPTHASFGARTR